MVCCERLYGRTSCHSALTGFDIADVSCRQQISASSIKLLLTGILTLCHVYGQHVSNYFRSPLSADKPVDLEENDLNVPFASCCGTFKIQLFIPTTVEIPSRTGPLGTFNGRRPNRRRVRHWERAPKPWTGTGNGNFRHM